MDMPAKDVATWFLAWLVAAAEWTDAPAVGDTLYVPVVRWIAGTLIMIAADDDDFQALIPLSPIKERLEHGFGTPRARVEEVTQHNQLFRGCLFDRLFKPV